MRKCPRSQSRIWVRVALTSALTTAVLSGGAALDPTFAPTRAYAATTNSASVTGIEDYRYGPLNINQTLWRYVPYFVSQKTTFFGIWYLQQMLKDQGVPSNWDGHSLTFTDLPTIGTNATISVNGFALPQAASVEYQGHTYVTASTVLQALGGSSRYDATSRTLSVSYNPSQASTQLTTQSTMSNQTSSPSTTQSGMPNQPASQSSNQTPSQASSLSGSSLATVGTEVTLFAQHPGRLDNASDLTEPSLVWHNIRIIPSGGGTSPGQVITKLSPTGSTSRSLADSASGDVSVGGATWRTVPIVVDNNTTFFGIWYLQQLLSEHGIHSSWNGKALTVSNLPKVVSNGTIKVGQTTKPSTLILYNGRVLMPLSALSGMGISVLEDAASQSINIRTSNANLRVQGTLTTSANHPAAGLVAIQDAEGNVQVVTAGSDGSFSAQVSRFGSSVIGVRTPDEGWIGEDVPLTPGNASHVSVAAEQSMVTLHGQVAFATRATYPVVQVSVRNVITHAHYYATVQPDGSFTMTVPVGAYEAFALVTNEDALFILQNFLAGPASSNLVIHAPTLPTGEEVSSLHATVQTTDSNVTPEALQSVDNLFEHVYQETVASEGITPVQKMNIHLYGSINAYQQHYLNEGYGKSDAQAIAEQSVASEEGTNTINILMPTLSTVDGLNILAHEFTHALTAQVSQKIPSWANEGGAWTQGVNAETDQSPSSMLKQGIQWNEWVDIVAHQQSNTLLPLGQASSLAGNYNVEAQDYFAVQQLVGQFGWPKFMKYVRAIDHDANAFSDTFGESFSTFSQHVTAVLKKDAAGTSRGFNVSLRTLPNGPHQIYFISPSGQRFLVSGLEPNQSYTFACNADGTVTAPNSLTVTSVSGIPVAVQGDWFVGSGGSGTSQNRQEFDLVDEFGLPFLDEVILYAKGGSVEHVYPATAIPNGIEMISVAQK
ncbi:hypothetical protein [Alicyclobacillus ferrooxydans]|uniref:Copper amine oxidase-like N-terminal domain-containing protein n=1 Tax=Alicyclobacillus ferrooxydans TaxID=471514 RepID=A0A0P9EVG1_9BACL|nr:hypothetical protein [Alicyclobacillus ferrooxydans]KPV42970.1 hypothetical protein AN477_14960 [Alicyclobacillus ferrooxydans]